MQPDHILIVDDDREIRELLGTYLEKNGLRVTKAPSGKHMRTALDDVAIDLIVLDLMLPGEDGLTLCRDLRAGKHKAIPILMLTARGDEADRILGLEMGADDYLAKPFAPRELLARIRSVLRRTRMLPPNMQVERARALLAFGGWQLDTTGRHLTDASGTLVPLSGAEYRLLRVFLDHPQRVLNRDQLLNLTQGRDAELFERSIDLLVSRLRQRLGDGAREPRYIKTVRSEGYVFSEAVRPRQAPGNEISERVGNSIVNAVGTRYNVSVRALPDDPKHVQVHLALSDGAPLTIDLQASSMPVSSWLPALLAVQLALLAVCAFFAVRIATRPLRQLARAADALGPDLKSTALPEGGPSEVALAATAFNAMQKRIAGYLAERTQILAAISHDLQTPITRMRLRTELMDDDTQRGKMQHDLDEMVSLVREALAYAKSLHGADEEARRVDLDGLLDILRCDYEDAGKPVRVEGRAGQPVVTRPLALRRILTNLVDNALKFSANQEVTVAVEMTSTSVTIAVRDRGPGIPEAELVTVLQPFYRVENSRNRDTGGTGLGLAIAQQLSAALGGGSHWRTAKAA
jgi:two-component system OmpR family response regulator